MVESADNATPHQPDTAAAATDLVGDLATAARHFMTGLSRYTADFMIPYLLSTHYFQRAEKMQAAESTPADTLSAYLGLMLQNTTLFNRGMAGVLEVMQRYASMELAGLTDAAVKAAWQMDVSDLNQAVHRQARLMEQVAVGYPKAIGAIADEYGFHFERGTHPLVQETDRFRLYRIAPTVHGREMDPAAKPVLIIPPYVLGANILGFLPNEQRSYAHCFADRGIPTYIRILKDINTTEALQTMSAEDDAVDTAAFCRTIRNNHGKAVTLNGYCQGGYNALCALLSGVLDDLVDAFISCVAPMDGTRSKGLSGFLAKLPPRFNDLAYGTKILPNGNAVADGILMGWVYKLKSIETESPLAAFYRDLAMFARSQTEAMAVSKTAAALNYWLANERNDLPLAITRVSFAAFNTPISEDGTLPVRLFDRRLNLGRIREKRIPWLICYGTHDDLVEKACALAPVDFVDAEVAPFPKGHVAIATSWSHPASEYALHQRFEQGRYRGPVRFHLDLDQETDNHDQLNATRDGGVHG